MSERTTKKDAQIVFEMLLKALNKRQAKRFDDVGGYRLDYQPEYGGIIIEEIINNGGGVTHPIKSTRMNLKEFVSHIHFTLRAINILKEIEFNG